MSRERQNPVSKFPVGRRELELGLVPPDRAPCPSRAGTLEKSTGGFAEKREPERKCHQTCSWENYFGIRYGKRRLNVTDDKMHAESSVCLRGSWVTRTHAHAGHTVISFSSDFVDKLER